MEMICLEERELNDLCSCEEAGKLLKELLPPWIYSVVEVGVIEPRLDSSARWNPDMRVSVSHSSAARHRLCTSP